MLKHVSTSNLRRKESLETLGSTGSSGSRGSRASMHTVGLPCDRETETGIIRVFAQSLRADVEYITLVVSQLTTCRDLIQLAMNKCKIKSKDINLYYVSMEVTLRLSGEHVRRCLLLDDDSCPLELQTCQPQGAARFHIKMRQGGLIKIHAGNVISGAQYKSLLLADNTSSRDVISMLLHCYKITDSADNFSIREICKSADGYYERKLAATDCLRAVQRQQAETGDYCFVLWRDEKSRIKRRRRRHSIELLNTSSESEHSLAGECATLDRHSRAVSRQADALARLRVWMGDNRTSSYFV